LRVAVGTVAEYLPNDSCRNDTDLVLVIRRWGDLPGPIIAAIVAMVKAAAPEEKGGGR
jgi:hypothetical protein